MADFPDLEDADIRRGTDSGTIIRMARVADDFPELPLVPIDDGMTEEERARAWETWDDEWEASEMVDVGVTAAETLAEVRAESGA